MGARLSSVFGVGMLLLVPTSAFATEYYVATTGSDANAGTIDRPFATLQKGHDVAIAGDTVWIRGGTYTRVTGTTAAGRFYVLEERSVGCPAHQVLGLSGRAARLRLRSAPAQPDADSRRLFGHRELVAFQGARD
jgi:hypothetical protein